MLVKRINKKILPVTNVNIANNEKMYTSKLHNNFSMEELEKSLEKMSIIIFMKLEMGFKEYHLVWKICLEDF